MKQDRQTSGDPIFSKRISIALTAFLLEGLVGLFFLMFIPSDQEAGVLFGLSTGRLALLALHAGALVSLACLLFIDRQRKNTISIKISTLCHSISDKWIGLAAFGLMALTWIPLQLLLALFETTGIYREFAYYQRLLPTLGWFFLIGLQILIYILFKNRFILARFLLKNRPALLPTLVVFFFFALVALFSTVTGIGLKPDKYGWGAPGVPLMEWQIWVAILFSLFAAAALGGTYHAHAPLRKKDLFICIAIWLAAVVVWGSQPVPPGFFATPGRLPNFEIYPFSDGAFYDFYAQNIVIGNGYRGMQIPPRPLYILFLAIAHFIVGQDYNLVVLVQTFVLAFIPVCVFLIGRIMHSTAAGIAAAIMAVLRELTTILSTPFTDDVSNSKLLFADLPATLGIAIVLVFVLLWLRNPRNRSGLPMASGLAMGILLLIRTQSLLLLPVIFLVAFVIYRKNLRQFFPDFGLFLITMAVCIAPWLARNYSITGAFVFDHPESQSRVMAQRYDFNGDFDTHERKPGEETGEYSQRLSASIRQTIIEHPLYVAEFVSGHFLNNQIGDILILPIRWEISSPRELVFPSSPFWQQWNGQVTGKEGLLLAVNLLIISLGIGATWKRYKILAIFPLLINMTYNLSTAAARYSGWRYLLPVDWIVYFYYAIGLVVLAFLFFKRPGSSLDQVTPELEKSRPGSTPIQLPQAGKMAFLIAFALGIGSSLILAEKIIPARFSTSLNDDVIPQMLKNPQVISSGVDLQALSTFEAQPNTFIVKGKAFYPRYYHAGEGEEKTAKTGYEPSPDARLVFLTASTPDGLTILRTGTPPAYFPNGADVSIVGCQHQLFAEAFIVTVHGDREATYISPDALSLECKD